MSFTVEHHYRFDAQNKLDVDDWLLLPRAQLPADFALDDALAQMLMRLYLETVTRAGIIPVQVQADAHTVQLHLPLGKTAMIFAEPEVLVNAQRAETSWRIAGGFLLAHGVNYGGRFYIGAEWQDAALKLYSSIRRFPPRLVASLPGKNGVGLYNISQGVIHKKIQRQYLHRAAAQITGAT
ncbi:MAG: hypothetical protein HDKAJFGB_04035 [Anaerolineae bacterium]|nr:hypothetical protein [Anaerolineae bacterium]